MVWTIPYFSLINQTDNGGEDIAILGNLDLPYVMDSTHQSFHRKDIPYNLYEFLRDQFIKLDRFF